MGKIVQTPGKYRTEPGNTSHNLGTLHQTHMKQNPNDF